MILRTRRQPSPARLSLFCAHLLILILVVWLDLIHRSRKLDGLTPCFVIPKRSQRFQVFSRVKADSESSSQ